MNVFFFTAKYIYNKIRLKNLTLFKFSSNISKDSTFEGLNSIGRYTQVNGAFGLGTYVCDYCYILANVGRYTSIGSFVRINPGIHPFKAPYVSTSPFFYSMRKQNGSTLTDFERFDEIKYIDKNNKIPVIIGNDCWIGDGVFITGGLRIGDGAVILAHSVVTKDIPSYAIVGGVPAKILSYRYDESTIQFLLNLKWWDKDDDWLKNNLDLMCNIEKLKETYNT